MDWESEAGRAVIEAAREAGGRAHVHHQQKYGPNSENMRLVVDAALDAAVAARVPCPTCGGSGRSCTTTVCASPFHRCGDCVDGTVSALALLLGGER